MKYTPSALLSELSGKQGSTVASHNRFGPYLRNRVIPVNRNTLAQQNVRNNLAAASINWRSLTAAQQLAWTVAASLVTLIDRLGRPYSPTGAQYYISTYRYTYVYDTTAAAGSTPPGGAAPVALLTVTPTLTLIGNVVSLAFTATPLAALTKIVIECTGPLSLGVSFVSRSQFKQIFVGAAASASPAVATTGYAAIFGGLITGRRYFFRVYAVNSAGQASAPIVVSQTV